MDRIIPHEEARVRADYFRALYQRSILGEDDAQAIAKDTGVAVDTVVADIERIKNTLHGLGSAQKDFLETINAFRGMEIVLPDEPHITAQTPGSIESIILMGELPARGPSVKDAIRSAGAQGYEVREYTWVGLRDAKDILACRDRQDVLPAVYLSRREEMPAITAVILQRPGDADYRLFAFAASLCRELF